MKIQFLLLSAALCCDLLLANAEKNAADISIESQTVRSKKPQNKPNVSQVALGNLKKHLWFLENNGQSYRKYGFDHRWQELRGRHNADIQLPKYPLKLKKKIRISVIDSGIHPNHAYLNGFVHWSNLEKYGATEIVSKPGGPLVEMSDSEGHGTFVAGIVASVLRNIIVQDQTPEDFFEIIPIKLFNFSNERNLIENHIFNNFNRGLLKALELESDVIISSFSWPRFHEHPELHQTLELLAKRGVIFVAAAGNKVSRNLNYPCDSKFVLCVGGTNQQGEFAKQYSQPGPESGSNYGLGVDVLAPAVNMVSSSSPQDLPPIEVLESDSPLYSMDGTSFSAPIVAAEAAILKALFPNESREQILSRIYLGTQNLARDSHLDGVSVAAFGSVSIRGAIEAKPQPLILPLLKDRLTFVWNPQTKKVPLSFQCINAPCPKSEFEIEFHQFGSSETFFRFADTIDTSKSVDVTKWFPIEIKSSGSNRINFKLKLKSANQIREYHGMLTALQEPSKLKIETLDLHINQNLREPIAIYGSKRRQAVLIDPQEQKIAWVDYKDRSQKVATIKNLIQVRFAFQRDFDNDGVEDLLLIGVIKNENDPQNNHEAILYLDKKLNFLKDIPEPIIVDIPKGTWPADSSLFKWRTIDYINAKIQVPAYIGFGLQSSSPSEWGLHPRAFLESRNGSDPRRLWISFKYDVRDKQLKTISLSDYGFFKNVYKALGLDPEDDFVLLEALKADPSDHRALATVRKQSSTYSVILDSDSSFANWQVHKSSYTAVLNGRFPTQFWHPEVYGDSRTFILQEVNKYHMTALYEDQIGAFEFAIVDAIPIGFVIDATRIGPDLFLYTANDLTMKSWKISPNDRRAQFVSEMHLDFMNYYENLRQILTYDFPKANKQGTFEFVTQNAYWNGNELGSIKSTSRGELYKSLENSYAIPSGCVLSTVLSNGDFDDGILGVAICIGKKNQHFIFVPTK